MRNYNLESIFEFLTAIDEDNFEIEINEKNEGSEHVEHVEQTKIFAISKTIAQFEKQWGQ